MTNNEREPLVLSEIRRQRRESGEGLRCPQCGCRDLRVIKVEGQVDEKKRRRECRHCGHRMNSYERIAPDDQTQR